MATIRMRRDGAGTDRGRTAWPSLAVALAAPWLRAAGTKGVHMQARRMILAVFVFCLAASLATR